MNVELKSVEITNGNMNYVTFGDGDQTLVIISGMSMVGVDAMAEGVATAYMMFAEDCTVYLFDRIDNLADDATIRDMAEDLADAMRKIGIKEAHVMGNSQGGMIAQYLAIDNPDLVKSLVLSSTYCRPSEIGNETFKLWSEMANANDGRGLYRDFFTKGYSKPDMKLLALIEDSATDEQCRKFGTMARANLTFDVRNELKKIKCPVLVIGVEDDKVLGVEGTNEIAEILGCEKLIYKEFAHSVIDEAPDIKQRIKNFIDK